MQKSFGIGAAAVGAMVFMSMAPSAMAGTTTEGPFTTSSTLTDFGGSDGSAFFTVPKFNLLGEMLTNVNVELDSNFATTMVITNSAAITSFGTAAVTVDEGITNGTILNSGPGNLALSGSTVGLSEHTNESNGVVYSLAAGGSTTLTDDNAPGYSLLGNFSTAPELALFTGVGNVTMNYGTYTVTDLGNSGGNTSESQTTFDTLGATFIYTYTASVGGTPEPGAWGLLCAGSTGGLVFLRRRRARK